MKYLSTIIATATELSFTLFKLMIPIIILLKVLELMGAIGWLSDALSPLMGYVGLPGAMSLVWATALLTNLYGGIVVFATLAPDLSLTTAQVTIISSMMLIAHALPVEARIAQKAGVRFHFTILFRIGMALLFGALLNQVYLLFDWHQQPVELLWFPEAIDPSLTMWLINQLTGLVVIYLIVLLLVLVLDILRRIGIIDKINTALRPILHLLGIGREAESITLVGLTLGISYGGALLIKEAQAGHVTARDILFSFSLLGLSHSLIEDTLLMMLIGADISGILIGRVIFSLFIIYAMVRVVTLLSERFVDRHLVGQPS